ncbi:hypothetical protein ACKRZS_013628 [Fusarium odoratissimum]|uniref:C2H2-type domain-containing protein n=4 Tax=Fusarium oxysporum species complex TaxID=171631 RepID=N1RK47_FUSC4|nr:uncharacterized protein FOIG_04104 [Fusarium odoratissimum NRRL 54006]EMT65886.1 hypothetical protein FOC4_g10008001 [Fusarium odoratissimum]EXM27083.1 hypothetical protein FOTG_06494 [Fusarium oxysporum f. sp. vasinfectum 25433]KAH7214702.1 hypothetical protein DER44DRAFT_740248 [Fusarium oxysporum]KAK2126114.1 hypothetical protein NOF04DRAFT_1190674 [Fusarium oxysporum II5]KAK2670824.1 Zinc finger C2H2-type [Fusarium oxysporum f. sp. vasinfectum]TXB99530.1 hypothetical protein FocTR4_000
MNMFPFPVQEDQVRPLSEEDQQILLGLTRRYGVSSLVCALSGLGAGSRASTFSASTLLSNTSAPSLAWSSSEASHARSDAASIRTQSTWQDNAGDVPSIHEGEIGKVADRTWLDSPNLMQSPIPSCDVTSHPSPRHVTPTSKKYQCPMCFLDNNPVGFGRKSDFKKHLYNFHGADVTWLCKTKGCHLSFATERAYSTHAKETHRMDALPNSTAKTELCPQVVFGCGFASCKDRVFEASSNDQASSSRDKYFEHIAKHFEDGFDVNNWEYKVQVHNLMRQSKVKSVFKTCIWPKEKRMQLTWRPRSSGDLKRMLEARHLGEDISTLVRLAFILGTSPFTSPTTPPPSEIDLQFSLPFRSQCLMDTVGHADGAQSTTAETSETNTPMVTVTKQAPQTPEAPSFPARRIKQETRPTTPMDGLPEPMVHDDLTAGPHPGTPFPIPNEHVWPVDAPKFAPDQMNTFADASMTYILPGQELPQQQWDMTGMQQHFPQQDTVMSNVYMPPQQPVAARPATPIPSKRPGSWGKRLSLENLRPKKKTSVYGSPASEHEAVPPVPAMYAEMIPTSMPAGYELPMRMGHPQQGYTSNPGFMPQAQQQQFGSPTTFYLDDGDMRL